MTSPRQVLPGRTYMVSRRCAQRQLLLRPCATTTAIFAYVLGVAAKRYRISVHAYCVLSNHYHLVLTDHDGRLPAFGQYLDSLIARATNCSLGHWEAFWAPSSYSAVLLETPQDVIDKTAYVLANPVAAGLVRHARDWPGLWSAPERIDGEAFEWARPTVFFSEKVSMPKAVKLRLIRAPGFASTAEFVTPLIVALASYEERAAESRRAEKRPFLGVAGVLAQRPTSRPAPGEPRRKLNPRVACRDKWRRIEALQRLTTFLREYREAFRAWARGARDVVFPAGTYLMQVHHGVCCAAAS